MSDVYIKKIVKNVQNITKAVSTPICVPPIAMISLSTWTKEKLYYTWIQTNKRRAMERSRVKRVIHIVRDFVLFTFAYFFFFRSVYRIKKRENVVGLGHKWFNGNIKYLYYELTRKHNVKVYFVTANKVELERLKSFDVNVYNYKEMKNIPLFLATKVWVTASGHSYIPFSRAQIILRMFFGVRVSKWVDIWHGGGFKSTNRENRLVKYYDLGFVTSNFLKRCYSKGSNLSHKIKITGNPRTDVLIKENLSRQRISKEINVPLHRKNVLYAPTVREGYYRNFLFGDEAIFNEIENFCKMNNCNFFVRMHPLWLKEHPQQKKELKENIKRYKHIFDLSPEKYPDVQPILYVTDALITDWSSISSDFLILNRPILWIDIKLPKDAFFCVTPQDRVGYIVDNKKDFFEKLKEAVFSPKLFEEKRRKTIKKIYAHLNGKSSERCAQEISKLLLDDAAHTHAKNKTHLRSSANPHTC
jgi:CDP-ribitol ribitolphosphotransferase